MTESIKQSDQKFYIPLSPEAREQARGTSTSVWAESMKLLGVNDYDPAIYPTNLNYLRIEISKNPQIEDNNQKADLEIKRTSIDPSGEFTFIHESFVFYTTDGGCVVKTTSFQKDEEDPVEVNRHEVGKKELEELLKTLKQSRNVEGGTDSPRG